MTTRVRPESRARRRIRGRAYRVAIRTFLNRPGFHGKAALIASVEDTSEVPEQELRFPRTPDLYLSISDCASQCTLAFDLSGRDEQLNSLYKIDTLLLGLERFREALVDEINLYNHRRRTIWRNR